MKRIIHLSDLHLGPSHAFTEDVRSPVLKANLIELLNDDIREIGTPDFVIVSGDLTSTGRKEEFLMASQFLTELSERLELAADRFLLVPGNHDVLWAAGGDESSLGEYEAFASRFYRVPVEATSTRTLVSDEVFVLGLDSTRLLRQSLGGTGAIGRDQLEEAQVRVSEQAPQNARRFLVTHHHLLPVAWSEPPPENKPPSMTLDAPALIAWAQKHKFEVILHGHQHQFYLTTFHYADRPGGPLVISGVASIGGRDLPPQGRNGYQWIELDHRAIRFERRELDDSNEFRSLGIQTFWAEPTGVFYEGALPSARAHRTPSLIETRGTINAVAVEVMEKLSLAYGPLGGLAATSRIAGTAHVRDGLSMLRAQHSTDLVASRIVSLYEKLAQNMSTTVGDGRKTAVLLCCELTTQALSAVGKGHSDREITQELMAAASVAVDAMKLMAKPCRNTNQIYQIALSASSGNEVLSEKLKDAFSMVGKEGIVEISAFPSFGESEYYEILEYHHNFPIGGVPEWYHRAAAEEKSILAPLICVFNSKLSTFGSVKPLMEISAARERRPVVLFCKSVEGEAAAFISTNFIKGGPRIIPVQYSYRTDDALEDVAVLTGADYLDDSTGTSSASIDQLGQAKSVDLHSDYLVINPIDGFDANERFALHLKRLRGKRAAEQADFEERLYSTRVARLSGGLAKVRFRGTSDSENRLILMLAEDAKSAIKAAERSGIVPGGGIAYAAVRGRLRDLGTEGASFLAKALSLPAVLVSGKDSTKITEELRPPENWWQTGPIDPLDLVIHAISSAVELACRLTLTRIVEIAPADNK